MHKIVDTAAVLPGLPGITTLGLSDHGHLEIACPVSPGDVVTTDFACAMEIVGLFAAMVEHGHHIDPESTLGYGPSGVRVVMAGDTVRLVIEELAEPTKDAYGPWVPGVSRLASIMGAGAAAMEALGWEESPSFPSSRLMAMCCNRTNFLDPFSMGRDEPMEARESGDTDSGWAFLCLDDDHAHDVDQVNVIPLVHLTAHHPNLVPFLAAPVGVSLTFAEGKIFVFDPGVEEGRGVSAPPPWQPPWWST